MNITYTVELTNDERGALVAVTSKGTLGARKYKRSQILLLADQGECDVGISEVLSVSTSTIYRTKRAFVEHGLHEALHEKDRAGRPRKLAGRDEALLIATACSKPPEGRSRWTLQLLADQLVASTELESISLDTVRRRLNDNELKPWQKKMWCIPKFDANFVARMEHILELYARPADPGRPLVNFDEAMKQLVQEKRCAIPLKPGQPEKYDYEYRRCGVKNIFLFLDRHRGWRHAKVTDRKTAADFAECMRDLVDIHYPEAKFIDVVLDNLSTHSEAALYATFAPEEARRIARRLSFHYTPAHASWLNMVEIEIGIMNRQCLDRRIPTAAKLNSELAAWQRSRNTHKATIRWMFDLTRARERLARAYPQPCKTSATAN